MKVSVKVKAIAKKRPVIEAVPLDVPEGLTNANDLVSAIVRQNVREYNEQKTDREIFRYLSSAEIADRSVTGRIGFDERKNDRQQDEEQAVKNTLQCFADGIFRMLIGAEEIQYNQIIELHEGDELVFIRLTMLAGRLW